MATDSREGNIIPRKSIRQHGTLYPVFRCLLLDQCTMGRITRQTVGCRGKSKHVFFSQYSRKRGPELALEVSCSGRGLVAFRRRPWEMSLLFSDSKPRQRPAAWRIRIFPKGLSTFKEIPGSSQRFTRQQGTRLVYQSTSAVFRCSKPAFLSKKEA